MSSAPLTPLSPAAGSFVGTHSASYPLPKISHKPQQRFRLVNGSKLAPFPQSEVPYPLSYDKAILDCEALDHLFFKQLYRGISLHDWGDKQPNAVLDVGCGIGSWILDAARVWSSTTLLVGFDVVQIQPDLALIQDESLRLAERVRWVHGNFLHRLPFANEQFDYIHITRIALGLPENRWTVFLEEITRVLKRGGVIEVVEEDIIFPYQHPTPKMTSIREEGTPSRHEREGSGSSLAPSDSGEFVLSSARRSPSAPVRTSSITSRVRSRSLGATGRTANTSSFGSSAGTLSSTHGSTPNLARHSAVPQFEHIDKRKTVRDHFALQQAFNDMLDNRFINSQPTSQTAFYLSLHFQDIRAHAPLHFVAPPPRPTRAQTPSSHTGTTPLMHHKRSKTSSASSWSQIHSRNPSAQLDLPRMEVVRVGSAPSDSNNPAEIFITENTGIHLWRCLQYVLGCQEMIWESYHKLFPTSSRDQFDHLLRDFRHDMLSRTEAQSYLFGRLRNYVTSKEPSDDALTASLYADYSPLLEASSGLLPEPEKLEEEQRQQSRQISPLVCRTICAFLCTKGDRLYLGTSVGNLLIYSLERLQGADRTTATLVDTKKYLTRKSIEQLGYLKDINSLVSLSDNIVSLHALPNLTPTTTLQQTKGALCFTIETWVLYSLPDGTISPNKDTQGVPTVLTFLAVGRTRRIIVYSWKDGEAQDPKDIALPHSPRAIAVLNHNTAVMAYSQTAQIEYFLLDLTTSGTTDIELPSTVHHTPSTKLSGAVGMGMNAFSSLGGYMGTLGLGSKTKSTIIKTAPREFMIPKDDTGIFLGMDGKPTRHLGIDWPGTPEETVFVKPYLFATFPPNTVPTDKAQGAQSSTIPTSVLQVRSSLSLLPVQTLSYPFNKAPDPSAAANASTLRLLSPTPPSKSPLFLFSTPTDKAKLASEGSSVWMFSMRAWEEQIDELVETGRYSEALCLLDSIEDPLLQDKAKRKVKIQALHAVALFAQGEYDAAINIFINLDINPAKVVALYPVEIAGRLAIPESGWIELHGGNKSDRDAVAVLHNDREITEATDQTVTVEQDTPEVPSGENSSTSAEAKYRVSVETLLPYLSDLRRKVSGALTALQITSSEVARESPLSEASIEDVFSLPNAPPASLTPQQLLRYAQIVDTALFKSYLVARPGLLGPLCRLDNWCEVSEVEAVLRERGKFSELIFLYQGKKMHVKALGLLKDLSTKEDDEEKLGPTVRYLQKLGPEYLQIIFETSKWVFDVDPNTAFQIFTSEERVLPQHEVADFLEGISIATGARYTEWLISEMRDTSEAFHDRLAELYLHSLEDESEPQDSRNATYSKLVNFLSTSTYYRPDRIFGQLPRDGMFEVRAILLGRMGKHQAALEIYVYRLNSFAKAEEHCKLVYQAAPDTKGPFLTLLRIYLRPTASSTTSSMYLKPALDLISRHSPRLDPVETMQLLPPLVTAADVKPFLVEALRGPPKLNTRVHKEIWKARAEQIGWKLMTLQEKRVKVNDSRLCPQCHKRLGANIIAVHAPRGEVTHYHCREAFSTRLKERTLVPKLM